MYSENKKGERGIMKETWENRESMENTHTHTHTYIYIYIYIYIYTYTILFLNIFFPKFDTKNFLPNF